ncbi:hypothetical protein F2Q69_00011333 [Brassica cretica]|uniref:Uncharacterized protein n=1 Tax=Brassica cretica TaxID=69181 RepID=A0A8S9QRT6_BRACR|nr:hypothetical protein F2Q69_00011333 [Brassica cretica]
MISSRRLLPVGASLIIVPNPLSLVSDDSRSQFGFRRLGIVTLTEPVLAIVAEKHVVAVLTTIAEDDIQISVMSLSRWNKGHGLLQVLPYTTASRIEDVKIRAAAAASDLEHMAAESSVVPDFERGRFYDVYSARRNERLKRKKGGEEENTEVKGTLYNLGVDPMPTLNFLEEMPNRDMEAEKWIESREL